MDSGPRLRIAVVGAGVAGLSTAWLLNPRHEVVLYENADRIGGHANTVLAAVDEGEVPVDAGFIVFNPQTYPNFVELLKVLGVATQASTMSFAVSLDEGRLEYAGAPRALFAQPSNLINPRFWGMLKDLMRFYRSARGDMGASEDLTLGDLLAGGGYGPAFRDWHVLPMASAIWSAAPADILAYPAAAFIRFQANHGLLQFGGRPVWRAVSGGSVEYVSRLALPLAGRIRYATGVARILRTGAGATIVDMKGGRDAFDHVVLACHADEALALIDRPTAEERALLGAFRYSRNLAVMHTDPGFMPKRGRVWSSWNYLGGAERSQASVTYWMNRLQSLPTKTDVFVTLNPPRPPREESVITIAHYDHPLFDMGAIAAQKRLWRLQGVRSLWFCGAHFGAGFHEDALQAGLEVAEQLGGVKRPWTVANESGRIWLEPRRAPSLAKAAA